MALEDTITALDCVPHCDTLRDLDDGQFYALLIDRLGTAAAVDLADITTTHLSDTVDDAICDLQGRTAYAPTSPQQLKAIVLYLVSQL